MTNCSGLGRPGIPPHSNPSWQVLQALPHLARVTGELDMEVSGLRCTSIT